MNNLDKDAIRKEAEYLAQSEIYATRFSARLESARAELVEAYMVAELYAKTTAMHTRRTINRVDFILEALHDARGQS